MIIFIMLIKTSEKALFDYINKLLDLFVFYLFFNIFYIKNNKYYRYCFLAEKIF